MDTDDGDRAGWPVVPGYELHEVLGRGGFATVYRATQTSVDRPVALKVLAAAALDPTTERRFRHEVRAVGSLSDHPHVVALIDAGTTTTGAPFISMQLVPAGSLGDRIRAFGPLSPPDVARVGAEVADALEAAHEAGILHRDIKPDNILVGRRGRTLLTDFGIATLDDGTMTATGTLTGTLAYTAPEVIKGERPSAASDVFALGATLYALVAGRAAFATGDDHVAAVMWRVTNEEPPPLPPEVPFALVDLIGACMAKDPTERPALAEVATALEAIAADRAAAPTPTAEPDEPDATDEPDDATGAAAPLPPDEDAPTVVAADAAPAPPTPAEPDEATAVVGAATVVAPPAAPAAPPPARRPAGPGFPTRRLVVVAVLIALSMVAAVVLALTLGGGEDLPTELVVTDVGGDPSALAVAPDGGAWVTDRADGTVTHLGPDGEERGTTTVGASPSDVAATDDAVWVVNTDDSTLTRIDLGDGAEVVTNSTSDVPTAVAATEDDVWVASPDDDDLARIEPETGEYDREVVTQVDYDAAHLAIGSDVVWAALTLVDGSGLLLRIDPEGFTVTARRALDAAPSGIAVTDEAVWVALGTAAAVQRIDPGSARPVGTVPFEGRELGEVVLGPDDEVWVADLTTGDGAAVRIADDAEAETVAVGVRTRNIAVTDDAVWALDTGNGAVRRIPR